jgi:fructuronate reductase
MIRLARLEDVPTSLRPGYVPEAHGIGIVHLGLGAFHKAHQADYTDRALAASGGDWRILGVSLRSPKAAEELGPQNGLYTLVVREPVGTTGRVIGAIASALCSAGDPEPALAAMVSATCRIVGLTVTEKAYGLDRANRACDPSHPAVAADLLAPRRPQGVLGLLAEALRRRREAGTAPFTVLCCDNLPENGALVRAATIDFAQAVEPLLGDWIAAEVAFPSTMVDRITPAPTAATLAAAEALTGLVDLAAVETEPFTQWVIEDRFPLGRPDWGAAGAIFADDVAPFEAMKLRMLNGSHSMLAYAGFHAGLPVVRDVMADPALSRLVRRHLAAAAATLPPMPGIDLGRYADELATRFANPAIAHETFQIAMDGSEKLPQRIFAAVPHATDLRPFAFATAAWLRHVSGRTHDGPAYVLRDPRAEALTAAARGADAAALYDAVSALVPIPAPLRAETVPLLDAMLTRPMAEVIRDEAGW